jgi:hypothetical protein
VLTKLIHNGELHEMAHFEAQDARFLISPKNFDLYRAFEGVHKKWKFMWTVPSFPVDF